MASICKFMPKKGAYGEIMTLNFVYEAEFHTLPQPFYLPYYSVRLVTAGEGTIRFGGKSHALAVGDLFFTFPSAVFTMTGSADFEYVYISFTGDGAAALLESRRITPFSAVYGSFSMLIPLWQDAIRRVDTENANILTESMLLNALSYFKVGGGVNTEPKEATVFERIEHYVNLHFTDPDLSLGKLSWVFSYSEKYISHLFTANRGVGFSARLNELRIGKAVTLIGEGCGVVSGIAVACGFTDALYFSKVFKKRIGCTPTEYIRRNTVT